MRLIDADKLPATCNIAIVNGKVELNGWIAAERIDEAPTVEAIPIEWIKNIINANKYLWEKSKERMFIDQGVVEVVNYSLTVQILSELINRWEKENDKMS